MAKVEIEEGELAALRRQVAKLEADVERTKDYDAVKGELGTAKARLGELNAGREKAAFEQLGVTSEKAQKFLRLEYDGLPAEGKPADVVAWLEGMKADATKIPADLAPFIKPPTPGAGGGAGAGTQALAGAVPNTNTGAAVPPVVPGTFTPEQVEKMSFEELKANLPALLAQEPGLREVVSMFTPPSTTQPKA